MLDDGSLEGLALCTAFGPSVPLFPDASTGHERRNQGAALSEAEHAVCLALGLSAEAYLRTSGAERKETAIARAGGNSSQTCDGLSEVERAVCRRLGLSEGAFNASAGLGGGKAVS